MKTIAIITARGGSKRIPRKNIKEFCGKPIIAYSIEAAKKAKIFDMIMVSTDDEEIAAIARSFGAEVPSLRSKENSNDYATTSDVLLEVINTYKSKGNEYDIGMCIYPTAPFVKPERLRDSIVSIKESNADVVMPLVPFSFPPQRGFRIENDQVNFIYPEHINTRSQDLETYYHDAGQFYAFRVDGFLLRKNLLGGRIKPIILDEMEVQDIDNETDWRLAELKYSLSLEKND